MNRMTWISLLSLVALSSAHADSFRPMFEVGGGTETAIGQGGFNVLLRVNAGLGWSIDGTDLPPGVDQLILARIDGTMAVNPTADGDRIPYMNIRFIPISNRLNPQNIPLEIPNPIEPPPEGWPQAPDYSPGLVLDTGSGRRAFINLLPAGLHRDTRIGRDFSVRVSLVGLELSHLEHHIDNNDIAIFLQIAAELLGWKMIQQNGGYGTMHAFRIAGANAELAAAFKIASQFIVRIGMGVAADFNIGGGAGGFTIQSDQELYARLAFDITRFIQISARLGILNAADRNGDRIIYQFMSGLSIRLE